MNSVTTKVAEQIALLGPSIEDKVTDVLVEREKEKRANALVKVIDFYAQVEKELKKIKPDLSYMTEDNKVTPMFSKTRLEELNKAKQKVERHARAIEKALDKKDFSDVYNIAAGKEPESTNDNEPATPAA